MRPRSAWLTAIPDPEETATRRWKAPAWPGVSSGGLCVKGGMVRITRLTGEHGLAGEQSSMLAGAIEAPLIAVVAASSHASIYQARETEGGQVPGFSPVGAEVDVTPVWS